MRFAVLASGSSGNACYVEAGNTSVLIDAGLSGREIERRLEMVGRSAANLDALIVTHEHLDHIKGAGVLSRRFDLPVYINQKTLEMGRKTLGKVLRTKIVQTGQALKIKDLNVETFTKCHDAADPVGLVLTLNGVRFGMVTDLGKSTRLVEDRLKGCQTLLLEFNHDPEMLENGPYPLYLKRRIKGRDGHLSNDQAGDLLESVSHVKLKQVVLAHLSEQNNHPDKALERASAVLENCGLGQTNVVISRQHKPGPLLEVE